MARIAIPSHVNCPHCGARHPAAEERCTRCGQPLTLYIGPPESFPRRLDLRSIMVLIAVIAVCLGLTHEVPVLGIFLVIIVVPALLRTIVWINRANGDGLPMIWPEKLGAFAASVGVVWLILLGAVVGFGLVFTLASLGVTALRAILMGGPASSPILIATSLPLGCLGGATVGYFLVRLLWPIKD